MTLNRASEILSILADGVNPVTGELLETDHICNSPDVIRALHVALNALEAMDSANPGILRKNGELNAGRSWTKEDLASLEHMYQSGMSMERICEKLQRRKRGVLKQLAYLGLAEKPAVSTGHGYQHPERAGLAWTHEEDILLTELYSENRPIVDIAARMQRSRYSIFCRMKRLELYGDSHGYPQPEDQI